MGLGLTLEQEKLTRDSLQNAIERIINGGFMERSLEASRELKQYDGCRKIVSIIEDFL